MLQCDNACGSPHYVRIAPKYSVEALTHCYLINSKQTNINVRNGHISCYLYTHPTNADCTERICGKSPANHPETAGFSAPYTADSPF